MRYPTSNNNYWWVNQNQTYKQEISGGFLWSPRRKSNGAINPFYEFMRVVAPGDLVFSFADTFISAMGIVQSNAYQSPKPGEFGNAGPNWDAIGWRVEVKYIRLDNPIRPIDYIDQLRPTLPAKYSPLQRNGNGNQGVYLTNIPTVMADTLIGLIGDQAVQLNNMFNRISYPTSQQSQEDTATGLIEWEEHLITSLKDDETLSETEKEVLILARRGQGEFKKNVMQIENHCRITKVDKIQHLLASHIKPWRVCQSSHERLAGTNGLLLTPTIDHLFDRGFISFDSNGDLLISDAADVLSLDRMGIDKTQRNNVGGFNSGQQEYLSYHREEVFLKAKVRL